MRSYPGSAPPWRHDMSGVTILVTVVVLLIVGINAVPASAELPPCSKGSNYYGEACLFGEFHGAAATIRSYELSRNSAEFVNNDMWIVNHTSEPPHWIEAGIKDGYVCEEQENKGGKEEATCFKGQWSNGPKFFWADARPGTLFYAHMGESASLGTAYGDKIYYKGNEEWTVEVGSLKGVSSKNPLSANLIRTGTEETNQTSTVCSEQYNLEWLNPSTNEWHSGWNNSKEEGQVVGSNPPYAWWVTKNTWVRDASENSSSCY